jgi:hypothetical protein
MLSATTFITFHRFSSNEPGKDAVFFALSLSALSVQANALKAATRIKKYFFIESDKIKKSNFEKPKLDFYKKKNIFTC